jgi:ribosomal protein S18 acetylase RimI-like enzyme
LASAGSAELIARDGQHLRLGPWRGRDDVAYLAPLGDPSPAVLEAAMQRLRDRGFRRVLTSAIAEPDVPPFQAFGFVEHERLHLLAHDLHGVEPVRRRASRRARLYDRDDVLRIDAAAFEPFWRLDADGLADALAATPVSRYRVTVADGRPTGYAVFGLAGQRGYLQRLAVDPAFARRGLASTLIRDGLSWLSRRNATGALVNTQTRNERALRVYLDHGFALQSYQLVVLQASVAPGPPAVQ